MIGFIYTPYYISNRATNVKLQIKYRSFLCGTTSRYADVTSRLIDKSSINIIWLSICFPPPSELLIEQQKKL